MKRFEVEYGLGKDNSSVKSTATALNFPLKLAEAVTAHKVKSFEEMKSSYFTLLDPRSNSEVSHSCRSRLEEMWS